MLIALGRMSFQNRTAVMAVVLATFAAAYAGVIRSLVDVWSTNFLYSYGFAVPLIAAYIVHSRWQHLPDQPPDYALGLPLVLTGCLMLLVADVAALGTIEQVSLIVTLAGLVTLLWGRATLKRHWFAVAYLLLMVPIWNQPIAALQDPSRRLSARIAAAMLDGIGYPVHLQDTIISLPGHTLSVMGECSGVNQLVAVAAMIVPAAYLWLNRAVVRLVLLTFAVAITYIGNGFRIALVGWLALHGLGDGDPNGKYHLMQGLLVSIFSYGAIGLAFSVLSRFNSPSGSGTATAAASGAQPWSMAQRRWLDAAVVVAIAVTGTVRLAGTTTEIRLQRDLQSLDPSLGGWTMDIAPAVGVRFPGIDDALLGAYPSPAGERRFPQVDEQLIRTYRHTSGARVQLYVAYYHRQQHGKEIAGELAGILRTAAHPATVDGAAGPVAVRELVRDHGGTQRGVVFWYDINGRIVPDVYQAKGYTLWDAVTRRRTNAAVVMIAWQGSPLIPAENARQRALEFARSAMPALRLHLPS